MLTDLDRPDWRRAAESLADCVYATGQFASATETVTNLLDRPDRPDRPDRDLPGRQRALTVVIVFGSRLGSAAAARAEARSLAVTLPSRGLRSAAG